MTAPAPIVTLVRPGDLVETALDRRLADLITRRRLVGWPDLVRLRDEAMKRGEARAGSPLAAALVRTGTLPAPQVDELLVAALGVSAESSGARAFFQEPGASGIVQTGFFPAVPAPAVKTGFFPAVPAPTAPEADPERTVLDAAAPIALPTRPPASPAPRPPSAGLPLPTPRPSSTGLPAVAPARPAAPRPAPTPADDDGARTIAAPPVFSAPAARAGPTPTADDGDRTVAAPIDGFGASPAGPAGFGASPAGFGSGPAGFGSGPAGFGSGPAGFGGGPGVHGGQSNGGPRTKAGPSEEEAAALASQRLAAVFQGGRFARKESIGADGRTRATDQRIRRPVLLALGPAITPEAAPSHPFFREARLLAAVGHPAVPRVHDAGVDGGRAFVAYDLPEGDRLAEVLRSRQRPALPALLRAFLEVTAAVARAHEAGVLHGSLGPQRVVLGEHGRVLVDGWAWARALAGAPAEVDEAAALPPPPDEDDPPRRAPEASRDRADARTDVFGLGLVLEGLLKGARPPGPLLAVARKALNPTPARRYHSVRALQEDVRRFLDGRSVSAEAESLLGAAVRLGRKHPGAAAVAGVLGLLLVGVAGVTGLRIRGKRADVAAAVGKIDERKEAIQKDQDRAVAQTGAAKKLRELTEWLPRIEALREQARLAYRDQERITGGLAGPLKAKAIATDKDIAARLERAIRLAGDGLHELAAAERSAVARAEVKALGQVLVQARCAARLALATFWLREANRTRPDLALAEYQGLAAEPGVSVGLQAEGYLGAYLSARRLAGEELSSAAALEKLARLDHPLAGLARVVPLVRASIETRSTDELKRRDGEVVQALNATRERPLSLELRAYVPSETPGGGDHIRRLMTAALVEPSDPAAYVDAIRLHNESSGLTPLWRYSSGDNLTVALRRSSRLGLEGTPCALDPTPAIGVATYLQQVQRKAASRQVIEPVVQELEPLASKRPEVRAALTRARLLLARARLADGQDPAVDLDELQVPREREVERHGLRFWSALRAGAVERALAALRDLFPLVIPDANRRLTPPMYAALDDLADALVDPAIPPQTVIEVTTPVLAQGGPPDFHLARALASLRLDRDPGPDLDQAGGVRPNLEFLRYVGFARTLHIRQRGSPEAHVVAMRMWGQVNQWSQASEDSAVAARAALLKRLRDLGHHDAADAFERLDPVDELFVLPAWLPPEAAVWRRP